MDTTKDAMSPAALIVLMKLEYDNRKTMDGGWRSLPVENLSRFSHEVGPMLERMGLVESMEYGLYGLRLYRLTAMGRDHLGNLVNLPFGCKVDKTKMTIEVDVDEASLADAVSKVRAAMLGDEDDLIKKSAAVTAEAVATLIGRPRTTSIWRHVASSGRYELDQRVVILRFGHAEVCRDCVLVRVDWSKEEASYDKGQSGELCSLQTGAPFDSAWCVVYRGCRGTPGTWIRPVHEFFDGRFVRDRL